MKAIRKYNIRLLALKNISFLNLLFKRSNKIVMENYFCVRHKNRWKCDQHFELLFFMIIFIWAHQINYVEK